LISFKAPNQYVTKRSFSITLFKPEEFENAGFSFSTTSPSLCFEEAILPKAMHPLIIEWGLLLGVFLGTLPRDLSQEPSNKVHS